MRLVLSRKGFDSQYGGVASPIFPDGRMLSLPIPSPDESIRMGDLSLEGIDVGTLASDLTNKRCGVATRIHLDPDLAVDSICGRLPGWMPAFGQVGAAQSHLAGQGVSTGDLFLFFGWFRRVEYAGGRWRYCAHAPDMHVIFGWLQVGEVIRVLDATKALSTHPWLESHPHVEGFEGYSANNTIYAASQRLGLATKRQPSGGGVFGRFDKARCLTAPGGTRSLWSLPSLFMPGEGRPPLTYHGSRERWRSEADRVLLQTVGKGQEFVLHCNFYPGMLEWLSSLFDDQP